MGTDSAAVEIQFFSGADHETPCSVATSPRHQAS